MPKKVHRGTPPSAAVFEEDVFEDDREEAGARRRRALDDDSEESDGGLRRISVSSAFCETRHMAPDLGLACKHNRSLFMGRSTIS